MRLFLLLSEAQSSGFFPVCEPPDMLHWTSNLTSKWNLLSSTVCQLIWRKKLESQLMFFSFLSQNYGHVFIIRSLANLHGIYRVFKSAWPNPKQRLTVQNVPYYTCIRHYKKLQQMFINLVFQLNGHICKFVPFCANTLLRKVKLFSIVWHKYFMTLLSIFKSIRCSGSV